MTITTYNWSDDRKEFTIDAEEFTLELHKRSAHRDWRGYTQAPRIYVSVGEFDVAEHLVNRRRRPYTEFRKFIQGVVWPSLNWESTAPKLGWRQNAGCTMCPCSPGFVVQEPRLWTPIQEIGPYFDAWLTIKVPFASVDERKPAMVPVLI